MVTSANHAATRRNPLDVATREVDAAARARAQRQALRVVRVDDIPDSGAWVEHVGREVERSWA